MNLRIAVLGLVGSVLTACAGSAPDAAVNQDSEDIVRGQVENRLPQVVAVHLNGYGGSTLCSGTYIAPRVVLTAAHCMRPDQIPDQGFVYFGKDYLDDVNSLPTIPAPGARSNWARVETYAVNPTYSKNLNYPDMSLLFLDRELPFDPIPLDRRHVADRMDSGKIVGWGGDLALTPDITQVEGAGIKRSATVKILGSPTADDYHSDDPNPGMLDPTIRANLLKTDGHAPHANTCAGDSGGPLLVNTYGQQMVAGVMFWTGLSCEDYSIFTRIDPFLSYFDTETKLNGHSDITPRLECVEHESNGKLKARFGYDNTNDVTVNIPYGGHNSLPGDTKNARPQNFAPGDQAFAFSVEFSSRSSLAWKLDPPYTKSTTVRADSHSPACDPTDNTLLCGDACNNELKAACASPTAHRSDCMSQCTSTADYITALGCGSQYGDYLKCSAGLSSDASNWDCSTAGIAPSPLSPACDDQFNALVTCLYY
ncbi:MAG TPA: trypsin-like serine protease [Polyangiaceae bacterium]|nr:trypsin-like serine protease [Polyangiaceae bacterium]